MHTSSWLYEICDFTSEQKQIEFTMQYVFLTYSGIWYIHQQQQSIVTGIREVWWVGDLQR